MNRKCKVCGYIFRDDDEQICPECFTAREEDISCESYSHDDHCDDSYSHFKEMESKPRYFDETFEDDNSFIEENLKEERRNKFAKAEQKQANTVSMGNTNNTGNNTTPRISIKNNKNYYFAGANNNAAQKPKKKSGCTKFVFILIAILWILPGSCSKIINYVNRMQDKALSSSSSNSTAAVNSVLQKTLVDDNGYTAKYSVKITGSPKDFDFKKVISSNILYANKDVKKSDSIRLMIFPVYPDTQDLKKVEINTITCNSYNADGINTMQSTPVDEKTIEWGKAGFYDFFIDNDATKLVFNVSYTIDGTKKECKTTYELP